MLDAVLPKISVITVVYNGVKDMEQTMLSVLNQTYPEIEYIVIDGGSTDGTVDIIKKYEQRLAYWVSEPDKGIYYAMNKGILKATGKWIHFRNCGDYFFGNDVVEQIFTCPVDPDVKVIHGDCRVWDQYGYCDKKPAILTQSFQKAMPVFHPSSFIQTELHRKRLFDTSYKLSADYHFFFTCLVHKVKFRYYPITVSLINVGEGASVNNRTLGLKENLRLRGKASDWVDNLLFQTEVVTIWMKQQIKFLIPDKLIRKWQKRSRAKAGWVFTDTSSIHSILK